MKIYSIKNVKLGFFNRPIYAENDAEVLSYIQNVLMSDADRALMSLKDDLSLFYIGDFDSKTGSITCCMTETDKFVTFDPVFVCSLRDIFDTIPADKIPRTEKELRALIDQQNKILLELSKKYISVKNALATLKVDKKGKVSYEGFDDEETE